MKAAIYTGPKQLEIQDIAIPEIGPRDVLIKVAYCGICGTDVHIFSGDGGAADVSPPLVIGHEFSGVVEAVGEKVTRVKVGDEVSVNPNDMCGACYFCQNGQEHFCTNFTGIGTTVNGGFAQYCVANEKQAYKTDGIDLLSAAMVEPLSCCLHGIDLCNIRPGSEVLVIGAGPIGLIMLQLAKLCGAGKVIMSAHSEEKRQAAFALGADLVIDPKTQNVSEVLKKEVKNLDVVIECAGSPKAIEDSIKWAGKGATVMLFGLTGPDAEIAIKPDFIFKKELKITSSFINPYTYERSIKLLRAKKVDVTSMIKHIIPIEDLPDALANDMLRKQGKVVVKL